MKVREAGWLELPTHIVPAASLQLVFATSLQLRSSYGNHRAQRETAGALLAEIALRELLGARRYTAWRSMPESRGRRCLAPARNASPKRFAPSARRWGGSAQ